MAASLIDFFSIYSTSGSFTSTALVGDVVLVFSSGYAAPSVTTTSDNYSNIYTQIDNIVNSCDSYYASITVAVAPVVNSGVLTITVNGISDIGFVAYLIRGVDNYVESYNSNVCSTDTNLQTPTQTTTDTCSLFTYWASEMSDVFSSFNLSQYTDYHEASHYHASGHILNVAPGSYTPGIIGSGSFTSILSAVFLRNSGTITTTSTTLAPTTTTTTTSSITTTTTTTFETINSIVKYWNGSTQITNFFKEWNGSDWVLKSQKEFDGSIWK